MFYKYCQFYSAHKDRRSNSFNNEVKRTLLFDKNDGVEELIKDNEHFLEKKNRIIMRLKQRFKSDQHNMLTVKVSKVASSSGDDKRVQIFNCIKSYTSVTGDKTKGGHGEKIKRVSLNI